MRRIRLAAYISKFMCCLYSIIAFPDVLPVKISNALFSPPTLRRALVRNVAYRSTVGPHPIAFQATRFSVTHWDSTDAILVLNQCFSTRSSYSKSGSLQFPARTCYPKWLWLTRDREQSEMRVAQSRPGVHNSFVSITLKRNHKRKTFKSQALKIVFDTGWLGWLDSVCGTSSPGSSAGGQGSTFDFEVLDDNQDAALVFCISGVSLTATGLSSSSVSMRLVLALDVFSLAAWTSCAVRRHIYHVKTLAGG
ncbi:uncharacterized protein BXZ73DRAFT_74753 [Epithele typhae]|uniref:uncharacterized protein n=1 Tax=Epithele typhae TaxID=378194 RepID=UPI0020083376|nr:uncharacterized protein BXZ73DRAFT_74753 [Epithele typhae]KAH9942508.1 hypothetical protein BXZ73DRAFT_74753 [Epithele typhae]